MAVQKVAYTVPGRSGPDSARVIELSQQRLHAYDDVQPTLEHMHSNVQRNVVGRHRKHAGGESATSGATDETEAAVAGAETEPSSTA